MAVHGSAWICLPRFFNVQVAAGAETLACTSFCILVRGRPALTVAGICTHRHMLVRSCIYTWTQGLMKHISQHLTPALDYYNKYFHFVIWGVAF